MASCLLLTGVLPFILAVVWIFVLGRFEPKFGKWGTFQIDCFIIGAGTASVFLAYVLAFLPFIRIGAVCNTLQILVVTLVGCGAAYWSLLSGIASHIGGQWLGINDWYGDAIGVVIATAAAFTAAAVVVRLVTAFINRRTEHPVAPYSEPAARSPQG
jgi:hypothetical protein